MLIESIHLGEVDFGDNYARISTYFDRSACVAADVVLSMSDEWRKKPEPTEYVLVPNKYCSLTFKITEKVMQTHTYFSVLLSLTLSISHIPTIVPLVLSLTRSFFLNTKR